MKDGQTIFVVINDDILESCGTYEHVGRVEKGNVACQREYVINHINQFVLH